MADDEGGWRPPDSKHPWLPPRNGGGQPPSPHNENPGGRRPRRNLTAYVAVIAFVIWTLGAIQWTSQDCDLPTSYGLVITHGFPNVFEGCGTGHGANVEND
ncbi:hypothetical protein ABZ424_05815 [Streptomyces sp. NPDC005790]|uniref:hypothetical protein n=1 Tax=Streptomyces sp. NPDC005790 TaxID=3154777 RepID=UPI003403FF22